MLKVLEMQNRNLRMLKSNLPTGASKVDRDGKISTLFNGSQCPDRVNSNLGPGRLRIRVHEKQKSSFATLPNRNVFSKGRKPKTRNIRYCTCI